MTTLSDFQLVIFRVAHAREIAWMKMVFSTQTMVAISCKNLQKCLNFSSRWRCISLKYWIIELFNPLFGSSKFFFGIYYYWIIIIHHLIIKYCKFKCVQLFYHIAQMHTLTHFYAIIIFCSLIKHNTPNTHTHTFVLFFLLKLILFFILS